jgi:hypothetical protein
MVEFARGGYEIHEPDTVPDERGWFGDITYIYNHAYQIAAEDLKGGNFLTIDVILTFLPANSRV